MNKAIYPLLSGGIAQEKRLETITSNLANANTTGYKKDHSLFRVFLPPPVSVSEQPSPWLQASLRKVSSTFFPLGDIVYVDGRETFTDFSPGTVRQTGNPMDLALEGPGFFVVQMPEGLQYTRNGSFILNSKRELATQDGYPVTGLDGPIRIEAGELIVDAQGRVTVQGNEVGTLKIVDFPRPHGLVKAGSGLFIGSGGVAAQRAQVVQGALEQSNVNSIAEMGLMIQVLRAYEAYQKGIQAVDEMQSRAVNEVGRVV